MPKALIPTMHRINKRAASALWTALILIPFVVLTGCTGTTGSGGSAVTPPAAPTISAQPTNVSAYIGDTATFSVSASGNPSPTYLWSRGGAAIPGATSTSYTTPALAASDDGATFAVTVTNSVGAVTSSAAKLSVSAKPASIASQPVDQTVTVGSSATFAVSAAGTAPFTYQWLRGGTVIVGATSSSYTLSNIGLADSGSTFSVQVSNSAATVTSSSAKLTVNPLPVSITAQPASDTQFVGETATFTVAANGTDPTFQWRRNGAAIPGATGTSYTTAALAATDDNAVFDVVVTNGAGSVNSSSATLRVGPFATTYVTQKGVTLNMYAWPGTRNAFLTKTAAIDPATMRKILVAADGAWNYYLGAVGQAPGLYKNYNGLATIANTGVGGVDLCGDGCTYIGSTGMELSDSVTNTLLTNVPNGIYDQAMFYEFGRSFWLFNNQIGYASPDSASCETTGFAVLMRYRSIAALGLTGSFGTPANYISFYNGTLPLIDMYAANASLTWSNTFLKDSFTSSNGGCADLWTSMVLRLAQNNGGEAFIQALFKEVLKRPAITTTQDGVDNFVLAASAAAGKNLTLSFGTTWRWPISTAASQEAQAKYGNPQ